MNLSRITKHSPIVSTHTSFTFIQNIVQLSLKVILYKHLIHTTHNNILSRDNISKITLKKSINNTIR